MKLLTQEVVEKATKQFAKGNDMDQLVVAKFFNPLNQWTWYLMNLDPEDHGYAWGIVKGYEVEVGSFDMNELQSIKVGLGLGIERDINFRPRPAREVLEKLNRGEHV